MNYPVNETFYSLKGEGRWTGYPMFFIRLSGCNLKCDFCDTPHQDFNMIDQDNLVREALSYPTKKVVITGGEPLIHDLTPLLSALAHNGYSVHLETNGTIQPRLHYRFNWLASSPKTVNFDKDVIAHSNEVKVLVGSQDWRSIASFVSVFARPDAYLYLMPLAKNWQEGDRTENDLIQSNVQEAIQYCFEHPKWGLCMQLHKILRIK